MNCLSPTGKPNIFKPFVVSLLFVNSLRHCEISVCSCLLMCCVGELLLVDASILLLLLFSLRPISFANFLNWMQKNKQSSCGTTAFRSSTYTRRFVIPPSLLSRYIFLICVVQLFFLAFCLIFE